MSSNTQSSTNPRPSTLGELIESVQLAWNLLRDGRVSPWLRFGIPALVAAYLIFPLDIFPDVIPGLGQVDDLAAIWIGLQFFLSQISPDLLAEYRTRKQRPTAPGGGATSARPQTEGDVIDGAYRVVE